MPAETLPPLVTRKPRTVKAPHGVARLTVHINGQAYAARFLPVDAGSGVTRLLRLRKDDQTAYHLARHDEGYCSCDCPSYEFDHNGNNDHPYCKHILAAEQVGLL